MRTTLTLEPDVAQKLKRKISEKKITLKEAVNQALRAGLASEKPATVRFKVTPFRIRLRPGIDPDKMNQLVDELEAEQHLRKRLR
jgi:hypothetical protein